MKLLSDILICFVGLFFLSIVIVIAEDWLEERHWEKKCSKCKIQGYYCIECLSKKLGLKK